MSEFTVWFSAADMRLLAWTLLHFLWQGLVLAAVFACLMTAFRSAATRYVLAVSVLILMIAAPIATFIFLRQSQALLPSPISSSVRLTAQEPAISSRADSPQLMSGNPISSDSFAWLVRFWMAGVVLLSLRTAGGMLIVERLQRRKASPVAPRLLQTCVDIQRRLGIKRAIRFWQCNGLDVPAVIGWFRPVVLLPMTVLTGLSEVQLEAVIAHELAHIKRCDYFVNLFQIVAETLLFYHPAVWWVSRRIRVERENCCDDTAVLLCGNVVDYARALTYMEGGRTAPSLVMAASGSPLKIRVMRLLGTKKSGERIISSGIAIGAICLAGGVFISQAVIRVANASSSIAPVTATAVQTVAVPTAIVPTVDVQPSTAPQPLGLATQVSPAPLPTPRIAAVAQVTPASPAVQGTTTAQSGSDVSYIDSLKSVGLDHLSVDDLVALKIQGVTADYVRQLHELGLKPGPDDLIAMRIHGITPEYIRDMRAAGITADGDELVAMKIQGVTPEYVRSLEALGLKPGADDLVAMRIQQITPEYIRDIRALGLNPTADELIAMHVQGITPAYIKSLSAAGLAKLDADDVVAAKVQGITPEFVDKARQHGFQKLDLDQLIALKHAGVL